ncbi:MAG TPA: hypothetical protein VF533_07080, partial [Solirubrobacteraceae bacterium]
DEFSVALGERGDWAVMLGRQVAKRRVRFSVVRGRRAGGRTVRQRLAPATYGYPTDAQAAVAVDAGGRTYAAWTRAVRPRAGRSPRASIIAAVARRGRPFRRGRVLAAAGRKRDCSFPRLAALPRGGAALRWRCTPFSADDEAPEDESLHRP